MIFNIQNSYVFEVFWVIVLTIFKIYIRSEMLFVFFFIIIGSLPFSLPFSPIWLISHGRTLPHWKRKWYFSSYWRIIFYLWMNNWNDLFDSLSKFKKVHDIVSPILKLIIIATSSKSNWKRKLRLLDSQNNWFIKFKI